MSSSETALDISCMEIALAEARHAATKGEVPVGGGNGGEPTGMHRSRRDQPLRMLAIALRPRAAPLPRRELLEEGLRVVPPLLRVDPAEALRQ